MKNQGMLCEYLGGSHAYGLATPTSDLDYRGVFKYQNVEFILGTNQTGSRTIVASETDSVYHELRHFLSLLRRGNPQAMETIFHTGPWISKAPFFKRIQEHRQQLVDARSVYDAHRGYAISEKALAFGERTGKLGKRVELIEKYGFSPKNVANLLRIVYAAHYFIENQFYLVSMTNTPIYSKLRAIRHTPELFTKAGLEAEVDEAIRLLDAAYTKHYEKIDKAYSYSPQVATELVLSCYIEDLVAASELSLSRKLGSRLVQFMDKYL